MKKKGKKKQYYRTNAENKQKCVNLCKIDLSCILGTYNLPITSRSIW